MEIVFPYANRSVTYDTSEIVASDTLQTSNPHIYVAGDVGSCYKFTHVAKELAKITVQNALNGNSEKQSVLGATIMANHAGDMISELAVAMASQKGAAAIATAIHPFPTQSEAIRGAAQLTKAPSLLRSGT